MSGELLALAYLVAGLLVLAVVWWRSLDADRGGYKDVILVGDTGYPAIGPFARDKVLHFAIAGVLTFVVRVIGGAPTETLVVTVLLGIGWELVQLHPRSGERGFFSWKDVAADAAGAIVGLGLGNVARELGAVVAR